MAILLAFARPPTSDVYAQAADVKTEDGFREPSHRRFTNLLAHRIHDCYVTLGLGHTLWAHLRRLVTDGFFVRII